MAPHAQVAIGDLFLAINGAPLVDPTRRAGPPGVVDKAAAEAYFAGCLDVIAKASAPASRSLSPTPPLLSTQPLPHVSLSHLSVLYALSTSSGGRPPAAAVPASGAAAAPGRERGDAVP